MVRKRLPALDFWHVQRGFDPDCGQNALAGGNNSAKVNATDRIGRGWDVFPAPVPVDRIADA